MIIVAFVCLYVYCVQSVSCLESIGNSLWHCGWVKMEKGPVLLLDQKWWILSYRAPVGADKSRKEKNLNQNISSLQSTLWSRRVQAKNLKRIFLISEYNQSINYSTLIHCEKNRPYPLWGPILHPDHRWDETPKTWALQQLLWQLGVP